jgi:hypothetical protein
MPASLVAAFLLWRRCPVLNVPGIVTRIEGASARLMVDGDRGVVRILDELPSPAAPAMSGSSPL